MIRIRKMLTQQLNEVLLSHDKDNVPSSRLSDLNLSTKEKKMKQRKQEKESDDCAQSIGNIRKSTGEGVKKKCHYKAFKFQGNQYGPVSFVFLFRFC